MVVPTKMIVLGCFCGYHHLRKHPYITGVYGHPSTPLEINDWIQKMKAWFKSHTIHVCISITVPTLTINMYHSFRQIYHTWMVWGIQKKSMTYVRGSFHTSLVPKKLFVGGFWKTKGFGWGKFFSQMVSTNSTWQAANSTWQSNKFNLTGFSRGCFRLRNAGRTRDRAKEGIGQEDWTTWKWHVFFKENITVICVVCFFEV